MDFIYTNIVVLTVAALVFWWLSGYDTRLSSLVTDDSVKKYYIRRAIRCVISMPLVELAFWSFWYGALPPYVAAIILLSLIWWGCIGELASQGFLLLTDPEDHREFDPKKDLRELDEIADLIQSGRKDEAIRLCQVLKQTGDVRLPVLEMTLEYLGVPQENFRKPRPLVKADRLRSQGKLNEAESMLNSLLVENPSNVEAALMLIQLFAQDMRRSDKACEVLRSIEKQPTIPSAYIEFVRRSIYEWRNPPKKVVVEVQPKSIYELIAHGYFGTAIEILEQKTKEQPQDFNLWMKLAETHGQHCGNVDRAEKIIQQIEANSAFSPEQIQHAKTKLKEWRVTRSCPPGW